MFFTTVLNEATRQYFIHKCAAAEQSGNTILEVQCVKYGLNLKNLYW